MTKRVVWVVVALLLVLTGCNTMRKVAGVAVQNEPSVNIKSAETRWLLIQNPRFGDVPSEPEYVWVEEDKVPTTFKTLLRGKGAIIAPPEVVARYGPPPGGGKISPRQGVPSQVATDPRAPAARGSAVAALRNGTATSASPTSAPVEMPKRGYVVQIDAKRIVIDLTSADGLRPGSLVSVRRDKTPVLHPVTGEVLGELDEEVAVARVTETREKFSVAEVQSVTPGLEILVRDRVVSK